MAGERKHIFTFFYFFIFVFFSEGAQPSSAATLDAELVADAEGAPVDEGFAVHAATPFGLDNREAESAFAGGDERSDGRERTDRPGRFRIGPLVSEQFGFQYLDALEGFGFRRAVGQECEDAGPGVVSADASLDDFGWQRPVNEPVVLLHLLCVGGVCVVLRLALQAAGEHEAEGFGHGDGAEDGEAVHEGGGGVIGADGFLGGEEDVAVVHALGHLHDGDAGECVAVGDGVLDGRGAAVFGQQGEVAVDAPVRRKGEDLLAEELPEGDDDDDVGLPCGDLLEGVGGVDVLGRDDGLDFIFDGVHFAGAGREALVASGGTVRLRHHADDLQQR